ncbi:aldehyde dehydrogenase family protein [Haloplanus salinarum]|uniref:aldehyde dehydrogenase family protein n=1 Tax=Haloplanus salinarum TaxID=1912324 RepID=UPI003B42E9D0
MTDWESSGSIQERHREAIAEATADIKFEAWIDGSHHSATNGDTFETTDPAVTEPIATVPRCTAADIDTAVAAAQDAFDGEWGSLDAADRVSLMREWADELRAERDRLGLLESLDTGKPLEFAKAEIDGAIEFIEYYADIARSHGGKQIPVGDESLVYTQREPYGVCGQITPWNFPLYLLAWKVGPALATGNTVVLKPAEQSPLTSIRVAQLSASVFPHGVLNVVPGYGDEAGAPLTEHDGVDKMAFTGNDETGAEIMKAAANTITPVTLELGGKSPMIVFPDADLETAAQAAADGIFYNTGQSCDAASRIIIHEDVKDEFTAKFLNAASEYTVGDPLVEGTTMGPLAHEGQYEKVTEYMTIGTEEDGATVRTGAVVPDDPALEDGWFVEPTVFDDVDNDMRIAQEEIFGPVQCLLTFSEYDEAIDIANDIDFGLAGYVLTENASLAHRAAADIEAGLVAVNKYPGDDLGVPFGGYKRSGIGRECAEESLDHYTQTKTVNMHLDDPEL